MESYDWKAFLRQWSEDVLATELAGAFPDEVRGSGWLGYPSATEEEIIRAEKRLGKKLPPSYRSFLRVTNGWRMVSPLLGRLWPTQEIEWLRLRRLGLVESWQMGEALAGPVQPVEDADYFVYGESQDSVMFRSEYLESALEISDLDVPQDAIYLLNPEVVSGDGEWEAWFFASWLPGAVRYRSFWEMMQAEYGRFKEGVLEGDITPDYVMYVAKQLKPRDPESVLQKMPDLVRSLQQSIKTSQARTNVRVNEPGALPGYQQGFLEGLTYAETQVRDIQARTNDPVTLIKELGELADELERLGRRGYQDLMQGFDLAAVLNAGMMYKATGDVDELDKQFQGSGKPAGYQAAASIIRAFLEEN